MRPQNRKGNKKSPMFPFPFPRITLNLYMQLPDIFMGGLAIGDRHGVGVVTWRARPLDSRVGLTRARVRKTRVSEQP